MRKIQSRPSAQQSRQQSNHTGDRKTLRLCVKCFPQQTDVPSSTVERMSMEQVAAAVADVI